MFGDLVIAIGYLPIGRKLITKLHRTNSTTPARKYFQDGSWVEAIIIGGLDKITIYGAGFHPDLVTAVDAGETIVVYGIDLNRRKVKKYAKVDKLAMLHPGVAADILEAENPFTFMAENGEYNCGVNTVSGRRVYVYFDWNHDHAMLGKSAHTLVGESLLDAGKTPTPSMTFEDDDTPSSWLFHTQQRINGNSCLVLAANLTSLETYDEDNPVLEWHYRDHGGDFKLLYDMISEDDTTVLLDGSLVSSHGRILLYDYPLNNTYATDLCFYFCVIIESSGNRLFYVLNRSKDEETGEYTEFSAHYDGLFEHERGGVTYSFMKILKDPKEQAVGYIERVDYTGNTQGSVDERGHYFRFYMTGSGSSLMDATHVFDLSMEDIFGEHDVFDGYNLEGLYLWEWMVAWLISMPPPIEEDEEAADGVVEDEEFMILFVYTMDYTGIEERGFDGIFAINNETEKLSTLYMPENNRQVGYLPHEVAHDGSKCLFAEEDRHRYGVEPQNVNWMVLDILADNLHNLHSFTGMQRIIDAGASYPPKFMED